MTHTNPYQEYTDETLLNSNPIGLVVALYEGLIDACATARKLLASGDIPARTKAINKATSILTELALTLNHEVGGDLSQNLLRLYDYAQRRVIESHQKKDPGPLKEVEKLMTTLLEGWKEAHNKYNPTYPTYNPTAQFSAAVAAVPTYEPIAETPYGTYMDGNHVTDYSDLYSRQAYSF
jgi:flagellar protein FliS